MQWLPLGTHAARPLLLGPEGGPEHAGELLERWVGGRMKCGLLRARQGTLSTLLYLRCVQR